MANKKRKELLEQIGKFFIVGVVATLIDWIIYYIAYHYMKINPMIANILSFSISVIYNYTASVKWVFNVDAGKSKKKLFVEFMIFSVIGLLLTEIILWIGIKKLLWNKMLMKVMSTGIVMVFNFVTRKIFLE